MKNMIKVSALVAGLLFASSAFASTTITSNGISFPNGTFKPSNNVTILATTDGPPATKYSAGAKHLSGDREYATTNTDSKIYYQPANVGTSAPSFGGSVADVPSSWTSQ